jgi:O-antigen/teichoic acid export membrane protein
MLAQLAINRTSVLLLGLWHGPEAVGLFYSSMRLAEIAQYINLACTVAYSQDIARLAAAGEREQLKELNRLASRLSFLAGVTVLAVFYVGGDKILGLFGVNFTAAKTCLDILLLGTLTSSFFAMTQPMLMLGGHERLAARIFVFNAIFHLTATVALVPGFGLIGAAWATAASTAMLAMSFALAVRSSFGFRAGAL